MFLEYLNLNSKLKFLSSSKESINSGMLWGVFLGSPRFLGSWAIKLCGSFRTACSGTATDNVSFSFWPAVTLFSGSLSFNTHFSTLLKYSCYNRVEEPCGKGMNLPQPLRRSAAADFVVQRSLCSSSVATVLIGGQTITLTLRTTENGVSLTGCVFVDMRRHATWLKGIGSFQKMKLWLIPQVHPLSRICNGMSLEENHITKWLSCREVRVRRCEADLKWKNCFCSSFSCGTCRNSTIKTRLRYPFFEFTFSTLRKICFTRKLISLHFEKSFWNEGLSASSDFTVALPHYLPYRTQSCATFLFVSTLRRRMACKPSIWGREGRRGVLLVNIVLYSQWEWQRSLTAGVGMGRAFRGSNIYYWAFR